jgi:hypothetical protein
MDRRAKLGLSALTLFAAFVLLAVSTRSYPARAGSIVSTGTPVAARFSHTATLLADGKVLLAGGMERNGVWLDSSELYDPDSGRFTPSGRMLSRRAGAMAVLLRNGKVLIAGGTDGSGKSLASSELFDPLTGTFSAGPVMFSPRSHGVAVLLKDGRVLFAGGCADGDNDRLSSAEVYDPVTGKFLLTGSMQTRRGAFNAVRLNDGRVLVTGGMSTGELPNPTIEASAEVFDPASGRFTATSPMSTARYKHGIALLADGRVLVIGGQTAGAYGPQLSSTEIFDPARARFLHGPEMKFRRFKLLQGVAVLNDGRVLVGGGADQPEIYDPRTSSFTPVTGPVLDAYLFSTVTALSDNRVLLADGYGKQALAGALHHAWIWQP